MVHGIITLFCIKPLKLLECLSLATVYYYTTPWLLLRHHTYFSLASIHHSKFEIWSLYSHVNLVGIFQSVLFMNTENRKTASDHKRKTFLETAGEKKIKTKHIKSLQNILRIK